VPNDRPRKRSFADAEMRPSTHDRPAPAHRGNVALRAAFPALVAEWQAYWEKQPWHQDAGQGGTDAMLEVLRAILDTAILVEQGSRQVHERLVRTAVAHGEQRRRQGATDEDVLGEYHALRTALWRYLLHRSPLAENLTTIFRVDVAMTAASTFALRGFMHGNVPEDYPWERQLARALADVSQSLELTLG